MGLTTTSPTPPPSLPLSLTNPHPGAARAARVTPRATIAHKTYGFVLCPAGNSRAHVHVSNRLRAKTGNRTPSLASGDLQIRSGGGGLSPVAIEREREIASNTSSLSFSSLPRRRGNPVTEQTGEARSSEEEEVQDVVGVQRR
jgi:hypothetical protein